MPVLLLLACGFGPEPTPAPPSPPPPPPRPTVPFDGRDPTTWQFEDPALQERYVQLREAARGVWPGGAHLDLEVDERHVEETWCRRTPCKAGSDGSVTLTAHVAGSAGNERVRKIQWRTLESRGGLSMALNWHVGDEETLQIAFWTQSRTDRTHLVLSHRLAVRVASDITVRVEEGTSGDMARACVQSPESLLAFAERMRVSHARNVLAELSSGDLIHWRRVGVDEYVEAPLTEDERRGAEAELIAWLEASHALLDRAPELHALAEEGMPKLLLSGP